MAEEIYVGNATADTAARGWLLGHFMPDGDARHSEDVEIKWGVHPVGERRREWATADPRTTLSVLISGRFHIEFPDRAVLLAEQGDYVLFRGVGHSWYAEEAATLVTVRWPSGHGLWPALAFVTCGDSGAEHGRESRPGNLGDREQRRSLVDSADQEGIARGWGLVPRPASR